MNFVVAVVHRVTNVRAAAQILSEELDFQLKACDDTAAVLENGALGITLRCARHDGMLQLNVSSNDLGKAIDQYASRSFSLSREIHWRTPDCEEAYLEGPYGIGLILERQYDEDELGILPDLPIALDWSSDALECIQRVIRFVPVTFRDIARQRVTERAEYKAVENGELSVDKRTALQALVRCTPDFQSDALRQALIEQGIDPQSLFDES